MTTRIWALFVKGRRPDVNSTGHPLRAVSTDAAVRVPQAQRCGTTGGRPDAAMQDRAWAVPEASAGAAPQHSGVCDTRKGTPVPRPAGRSRGKALPRPPKWSSVPASFRTIQRKVHAAGVRGRVVVGSGSTGPAQGPQGASLTCALTPPMERSARRLLSAWRFAPVAAPLSPPPDTALCRVVPLSTAEARPLRRWSAHPRSMVLPRDVRSDRYAGLHGGEPSAPNTVTASRCCAPATCVVLVPSRLDVHGHHAVPPVLGGGPSPPRRPTAANVQTAPHGTAPVADITQADAGDRGGWHATVSGCVRGGYRCTRPAVGGGAGGRRARHKIPRRPPGVGGTKHSAGGASATSIVGQHTVRDTRTMVVLVQSPRFDNRCGLGTRFSPSSGMASHRKRSPSG